MLRGQATSPHDGGGNEPRGSTKRLRVSRKGAEGSIREQRVNTVKQGRRMREQRASMREQREWTTKIVASAGAMRRQLSRTTITLSSIRKVDKKYMKHKK